MSRVVGRGVSRVVGSTFDIYVFIVIISEEIEHTLILFRFIGV